LRDGRTGVRALDVKVGEEDVADGAPAATAGEASGFVGGLKSGDADPGFDVYGVADVGFCF